ncbi:unnamed protein product [Vicia faba]|uniref:Uncharacterized protein n=1 Tax=Vicia faba TaxID=3906 RepID=A0AAV0ZEK4_VICFA|nr:unnamed protein product [Vicia faba]
MLAAKVSPPIPRCFPAPQVVTLEEEPDSTMDEQPTEVVASEMVEFEKSSAEDDTPYGIVKIIVATKMPPRLNETLKELKMKNIIILQRLDKQDQWIGEHSYLSHLMKGIIVRLSPPPPPPNP